MWPTTLVWLWLIAVTPPRGWVEELGCCSVAAEDSWTAGIWQAALPPTSWRRWHRIHQPGRGDIGVISPFYCRTGWSWPSNSHQVVSRCFEDSLLYNNLLDTQLAWGPAFMRLVPRSWAICRGPGTNCCTQWGGGSTPPDCLRRWWLRDLGEGCVFCSRVESLEHHFVECNCLNASLWTFRRVGSIVLVEGRWDWPDSFFCCCKSYKYCKKNVSWRPNQTKPNLSSHLLSLLTLLFGFSSFHFVFSHVLSSSPFFILTPVLIWAGRDVRGSSEKPGASAFTPSSAPVNMCMRRIRSSLSSDLTNPGGSRGFSGLNELF